MAMKKVVCCVVSVEIQVSILPKYSQKRFNISREGALSKKKHFSLRQKLSLETLDLFYEYFGQYTNLATYKC